MENFKIKKASSKNILEIVNFLNDRCEKIYLEGNYAEENEYVEVDRKVFEPELWSFGEQIYKEVKNNKEVLKYEEFHCFILSIIEETKYRTARQRFVLLLEDFKLFEYSDRLSPYLKDKFIYGHVLSYLVKGKAFDYVGPVKKIFSSEKKGWIKKLAEKYIELSNSQP